jgi:tRNA threonylcarbamoyladenosine biosynthesis protein TsaB
MVVLALDTTTRGGSCAVARDGTVVREHGGDAARPHDRRLPGDLMTLIDDARIDLRDVDVYAVATGPGSFTGLRIGIATMQGLAFADGKPLIGISAFDALVRIASGPVSRNDSAALRGSERVATWIDAWRGEVYAALYENGEEREPPTVQRPAELLSSMAGTGTVFIGDGADIYRDVIRAALHEHASVAEPAAPLLAATIARLAADLARGGYRPPPHAIRPVYVRRPDAELAREPRPVR